MKDRFLFRGKRITGKWVIGGLIPNGRIVVDNGEGLDFLPVLKTSIGQSTGVKDENGKLIFEGDVVHLGDGKIIYIIAWRDCGFVVKQNGNSSIIGLFHWLDKIEIIGNIHDNEELLEVKK